MIKRLFSLFLALTTMVSVVQLSTKTAHADSYTTLTFTDNSIEETIPGNGYSINGTTLTISQTGTYYLKGSCSEGSISVNKSLSDVVLILDSLDLSSSTTAPIVIKKGSSVTIHLEGNSTLTDNENPENENSTDPDIADAFEGAAIKVKSGSTLTFCGEGSLTVLGNAKNGIKGGSEASLIFADSDITINITAANNGLACDGSIVIQDGTFNINAVNDGIKTVPEETDTASAGSLTIHNGNFLIDVDGDGIQADSNLVINNGTFNITTFEGYYVSGTKYWNVANGYSADRAGTFNGDTMSCKGIKLSSDRGTENEIYITGGSFVLNTSDDAVHSDKNLYITGGTFNISSGDDGLHADSALTLGIQNGYDRDPDVKISYCYEGMEAANEYIYSGRYWLYALDDGINAADGSGGDSGGFVPGGPGHGDPSANDFSLEVYGGDVYVNCLGDGLDSNGSLLLYGGKLTVFSMAAGGDNSPLDADGTVKIDGAQVCAAGGAGMDGNLSSSCFSQRYYQSRSLNFSANTKFAVKHNNAVVYSDTFPRRISYFLFTSPSMTSNTAAVSSVSAVDSCHSNSWNHAWDAGAGVSSALMKYTCRNCGEVEYQTIVAAQDYDCGGHQPTQVEEDKGFAITLSWDDGVKQIDVYYTQDYSTPDEENVNEAVSRDTAGNPCSTGEGQFNFLIQLKPGYSIVSVSATEGTYKNIKGPEDTGAANTYRITKISADTTVTIETVSNFLVLKQTGMNTDGIQLQWNDLGADSYTLYRNNKPIAELTDTSFLDDVGRTMGNEYHYILQASRDSQNIDSNLVMVIYNPFEDVEYGTPSFTHVAWAYNNDIVGGVRVDGRDYYKLENKCTRAQFCIMLYKMNGLPDVGISSLPFKDIGDQTSNTKKAIVWCYDQGIVAGARSDNTIFSPKGNIKRSQLAIMLYKMAGQPSVDISELPFTDLASETANTKRAIVWCYNNHLIDSITEAQFQPNAQATRSLLTEMLYGYDQVNHIVQN